ncbi:MAG: putative quinol monooxygenase [Alcaligenaceae bacterium]|nr:putative quinol monooxygenase [Alcaligenaceae bacterium]
MEKEIVVVAMVKAKPQYISEVKQACMDIIAPTRWESGCLSYDLHIDLEQPESFVFYETWATVEDLVKHNEMPHFKVFLQALEGKFEDIKIQKMKKLVI